MTDAPMIYLIAGEASGDLLGGRMMSALQRQSPEIHFAGIGGEAMRAQGLQSLFPMHELSVMGLVEVLKHAPALLRRIRETVDDVLQKNPAVLVTIDAPDFCFRVARLVAKQNLDIRLVHYVAPSVWAWRPGRAKKVAVFLDHLLALLPFEPPYFTRQGLACTFVGHPAAENLERGDAESFRLRHGLKTSQNVILLLPGSRHGEISQLLPMFLDAGASLQAENPELIFVLPTLPHLMDVVQKTVAAHRVKCLVIGQGEKADAFASARAALAASGTVALELSLAGVPAVIAYKVNVISAWIARRLVKLKYVSLINLILQRDIMPEFLQERARPDLIVPAMRALLADTPRRRQQLAAGVEVATLLRPGGRDPSEIAAEVVLNEIRAVAATTSPGPPAK
jgi:lipid-A-disaccharide synthase